MNPGNYPEHFNKCAKPAVAALAVQQRHRRWRRCVFVDDEFWRGCCHCREIDTCVDSEQDLAAFRTADDGTAASNVFEHGFRVAAVDALDW